MRAIPQPALAEHLFELNKEVLGKVLRIKKVFYYFIMDIVTVNGMGQKVQELQIKMFSQVKCNFASELEQNFVIEYITVITRCYSKLQQSEITLNFHSLQLYS